MSFSRFHRSSSNFTNAGLSIDNLRSLVPSAFATQAHSSRSSRFAYIPTSDVLEGLYAQGFIATKAIQGRSRIEGKTEFTKHMVRLRQVDVSGIQVGSNIPEVVLINAHDGTSAYKLFSGIFRVACMNGLVVMERNLGELSIPHKGNVVHQVIDGSFEIIDSSRKALGTIENWQSLRLSDGEQNAFAEAAHSLRFADADGKIDTPITAKQLLSPRRNEDRDMNGSSWSRPAPDLYRTLNVVQENAIKGGLSARRPGDAQSAPRMVTTRQVNGIDQDVRLNRALWQLAERMAELKGVKAAA
jgi:Domain of unknown function (DUF932)